LVRENVIEDIHAYILGMLFWQAITDYKTTEMKGDFLYHARNVFTDLFWLSQTVNTN